LPDATVTTPVLVAIDPTESVLDINAYARVPPLPDVAVAVKIVCPGVFECSAKVVAVITPVDPAEAVPGEDQAVIAASEMH